MVIKNKPLLFLPGELSLVVSVALMAVVVAVFEEPLDNSAHTSTATPSETLAVTGTKIVTGWQESNKYHPCLKSITN